LDDAGDVIDLSKVFVRSYFDVGDDENTVDAAADDDEDGGIS
jgi:hypothetical protein